MIAHVVSFVNTIAQFQLRADTNLSDDAAVVEGLNAFLSYVYQSVAPSRAEQLLTIPKNFGQCPGSIDRSP